MPAFSPRNRSRFSPTAKVTSANCPAGRSPVREYGPDRRSASPHLIPLQAESRPESKKNADGQTNEPPAEAIAGDCDGTHIHLARMAAMRCRVTSNRRAISACLTPFAAKRLIAWLRFSSFCSR